LGRVYTQVQDSFSLALSFQNIPSFSPVPLWTQVDPGSMSWLLSSGWPGLSVCIFSASYFPPTVAWPCSKITKHTTHSMLEASSKFFSKSSCFVHSFLLLFSEFIATCIRVHLLGLQPFPFPTGCLFVGYWYSPWYCGFSGNGEKKRIELGMKWIHFVQLSVPGDRGFQTGT
jgi:hypothetical protein